MNSTFENLKEKNLSFTDNLNRHPPLSDIQFLLGDFSSSNVKLRTGIWSLLVALSKIYALKSDF